MSVRRPTIRVMLVDDQELVRRGFRALLETEPDIEIVGEAADGQEALSLASKVQPSIVLMDVRMPRLNGIEATRRLLERPTEQPMRVIILTAFDLDEYLFGAVRAGASGFLLKDVRKHELIRAIRAVAAGEAVISPAMTRRLLDRFVISLVPSENDFPVALASLTERERDVLRGIARGSSNSEIAQELHLTKATVKSHVSRVLEKLNVRDRLQAALVAYEVGLVRPPGLSDGLTQFSRRP
jgi:DNA-binding NarL/FixJ family response regulator